MHFLDVPCRCYYWIMKAKIKDPRNLCFIALNCLTAFRPNDWDPCCKHRANWPPIKTDNPSAVNPDYWSAPHKLPLVLKNRNSQIHGNTVTLKISQCFSYLFEADGHQARAVQLQVPEHPLGQLLILGIAAGRLSHALKPPHHEVSHLLMQCHTQLHRNKRTEKVKYQNFGRTRKTAAHQWRRTELLSKSLSERSIDKSAWMVLPSGDHYLHQISKFENMNKN